MSEKIVQLNEEAIKGQLKELVRGSVEETLNEMLEAEAEKLTKRRLLFRCKSLFCICRRMDSAKVPSCFL